MDSEKKGRKNQDRGGKRDKAQRKSPNAPVRPKSAPVLRVIVNERPTGDLPAAANFEVKLMGRDLALATLEGTPLFFVGLRGPAAEAAVIELVQERTSSLLGRQGEMALLFQGRGGSMADVGRQIAEMAPEVWVSFVAGYLHELRRLMSEHVDKVLRQLFGPRLRSV